MTAPCRSLVLFLAAGLTIFTSAAVQADEKSKTTKVKHDSAGTSVLMGELRALFATWDLNKDGYLDNEELARAFRGAGAKPYDPKANAGKTGAAKNPDYDFLIRLDQDGDGKISRSEFLDWARDYALEVKKASSAQNRISQLERSLARQLKDEERQKLTAELRAKREILNSLHKQMQGLEAIQKHLHHSKP